MGRLLQLLIMFGPAIMRAYSQYQRNQSRNSRQQPRNRGGYGQQPGGFGQPGGYQAPRQRRAPKPDNSLHKKSGIEKYKEYDYKGAIVDFKKALEIDPTDSNAHFNIACAYSLMEDKANAFVHLDQAVANGFKDVYRIKDHDGLAWLRVQKGFDKFEKNGFRLLK